MKFDPLWRKLSMQCLLPLLAALCAASELPGSLQSGDAFKNLTVGRHRVCLENQQYLHQELCCTNCRAGTFVLKACERDQEPGTCVSCEHGQTYTEHSNGMNRCLPCTHCRSDEVVTWPCSTTTDTRCQCRSGTFCVPEQACEVCKRCARCREGDEEVKACTPFSNTVCRKRDQAPPTSNPPGPPPPIAPPPPTAPPLPNFVVPVVVFLSVLLLLLLGAATLWAFYRHNWELHCLKTSCDSSEIVKIPIDESGATAEERQNDQNAGLEGEEPRPESRPLLQETGAGLRKACAVLEEEDRGLGDSLPNTTSSSQTSLSAPPTSGTTPTSSPAPLRHPTPPPPTDMDDPLERPLVPMLGSERSLRKTFDLFDQYLDVRIVNRFFRLLGVSDNSIVLAEGGASADKVYELLKVWLQREGLKADLNQLLEALLSLDQRRSAESIASAAIARGYYRHAPSP